MGSACDVERPEKRVNPDGLFTIRALGAPVFEVQLKRPRRNGRITLYPRLRGIVG